MGWHRFESKVGWILRVTRQHAWNLGRFVAIYKVAMIILKYAVSADTQEAGWHSFVAGGVGGFLVFRQETSVNTQVWRRLGGVWAGLPPGR